MCASKKFFLFINAFEASQVSHLAFEPFLSPNLSQKNDTSEVGLLIVIKIK